MSLFELNHWKKIQNWICNVVIFWWHLIFPNVENNIFTFFPFSHLETPDRCSGCAYVPERRKNWKEETGRGKILHHLSFMLSTTLNTWKCMTVISPYVGNYTSKSQRLFCQFIFMFIFNEFINILIFKILLFWICRAWMHNAGMHHLSNFITNTVQTEPRPDTNTTTNTTTATSFEIKFTSSRRFELSAGSFYGSHLSSS